MNAEEKYLFDLMGFIVVKHVLSREEVGELNALIDSYDLWRKAESGEEPAWMNDPNFTTVGAYPVWSCIAIVANALVLWAVTAHGMDG